MSRYVAGIRAKIGHDLLLLPSVAAAVFDDAGRVLLGSECGTTDGNLPVHLDDDIGVIADVNPFHGGVEPRRAKTPGQSGGDTTPAAAWLMFTGGHDGG